MEHLVNTVVVIMIFPLLQKSLADQDKGKQLASLEILGLTYILAVVAVVEKSLVVLAALDMVVQEDKEVPD